MGPLGEGAVSEQQVLIKEEQMERGGAWEQKVQGLRAERERERQREKISSPKNVGRQGKAQDTPHY